MTRLSLILYIPLLVSACRAATVSSISLTSTANSIRKGETTTLSCTTFYSDGTSGSCVSPAYTEDQSGTVVKIAGNTIFGYSIGLAKITANVSGISATLTIEVIPPIQELLGVITANQVIHGLGFNVDPASDWEFSMAAAAGATYVRFQCGWATLESQTAPPQNTPSSPRFTLQSYCQSAYISAHNYNLRPVIVAGYGPPYHAIAQVAIPGGAPVGATSIGVQLVSGNVLSSITPFYDMILRSDGEQISVAHSYPGALIITANASDAYHATLTLASALSSTLPADTTTLYTINELLYPPPATSSPGDPSVMRFAEYAEFLSQSLAGAGLTGAVELWNEPPWPDDRWDERANAYDVFPGPFNPGPKYPYLPNWGFVGALQGQSLPAGISYIWAGTEKSGSNSVLDPLMQVNSGVSFAEPPISVLSESFHPYGNNPEDALWVTPCWATTTGNNDFFSCNLFGLAGGNFSLAAQEDYLLKKSNPTYGISHNVTETGFSLAQGDIAHQARFIMRQFLGFQAAGVTPIIFYRLYDTSPDQLGFLDSSRNPLPAYTAIAGFMSELAKIGNPPVSNSSSSTLSSITGYNGTFPLDFVHIVGSRSNDTSNSEILALWQRSYSMHGDRWATMAQPDNGSVAVSIPAGWKVEQVRNLVTQTDISYTMVGQEIRVAISDDPIAVLVVPL